MNLFAIFFLWFWFIYYLINIILFTYSYFHQNDNNNNILTNSEIKYERELEEFFSNLPNNTMSENSISNPPNHIIL